MGRVPTCTMTDQDPALKIVIAQVFPTTRHQFYMWHIMTKVRDKVGQTLAKDDGFRRALSGIVWDEAISVDEFENRWHALMQQYGLVEHSWFRLMFDLRDHWIPAYFHDVFMGGLLRTTSRSESENIAFGSCISHHSSLLEFFTRFEGALDTQRHEQAKLNATCERHVSGVQTPLNIEQKAAEVYTINVFYDVQKEITAGCFSCRIATSTTANDLTIYTVEDTGGKLYTVQLNTGGVNVGCTCGMFNRNSLLCMHIFVALKDAKIDRIPTAYITGRWTRGAGVRPMYDVSGGWGDNSFNEDHGNNDVSEVWNEFYACLKQATGNSERLLGLARVLKEHRNDFKESEGCTTRAQGKSDVITAYYGTPATIAVSVQTPIISKNKGSGKRIKTAKEKSMERAAKAKRLCRAYH